jgi:hypothetical protein
LIEVSPDDLRRVAATLDAYAADLGAAAPIADSVVAPPGDPVEPALVAMLTSAEHAVTAGATAYRDIAARIRAAAAAYEQVDRGFG